MNNPATDDPHTFTLLRDRALDLRFEGWLLASESTRFDRPAPRSNVRFDDVEGRERWTEVRIYRTVTDKYVCELLGLSSLPGEETLRTVNVVSDPAAVPAALRIGGGHKKLTNVALDALNAAAILEPALNVSLVETI